MKKFNKFIKEDIEEDGEWTHSTLNDHETIMGYGEVLEKFIDVKSFSRYYDWQYSDMEEEDGYIIYEFYFDTLDEEDIKKLNKVANKFKFYIRSGSHDSVEPGHFTLTQINVNVSVSNDDIKKHISQYDIKPKNPPQN